MARSFAYKGILIALLIAIISGVVAA